MEELIQLLREGPYSCVIRNGKIYTYEQRGISDLYELLHHSPWILEGADIADKVVGKAAATLMVLGQIKRLHADTISDPALDMLQKAGIEVEFRQNVPLIQNRTKTGWCPLETLCREKSTPLECFISIQDFVNAQKNVI